MFRLDGDVGILLADTLGQLKFLEVLELRSDCSNLRQLHHRTVKSGLSAGTNSLIVQGEEHTKSQALKFEDIKDRIGL